MRILPNNEKYSRKYSLETRYNGIVFRSRLEARWAVYFDAIGAEYEYEPTGFELEGGIFYRPDFLVHLSNEQTQWCEVKGFLTDEDRKKINAFAKEMKSLLLLGKLPNAPYYFFDICGYMNDDGSMDSNNIIHVGPADESVFELMECSDAIDKNVFELMECNNAIYKMKDGSIQCAWYKDGVDVECVEAAIKKAATYNFEQGENK